MFHSSKKIFLTLFISTIVASLPTMAQRNGVSVKIALDSAHLLMGKQTPLHIEIAQPSNASGILLLPADTLSKEIEIAHVGQPDTTKAQGDAARMLIRQDIILQSFDSGLYAVGPLSYVTPGGDTIYSNPLSLKVVPADVDSLETIHSFAELQKGESKWWDFIPDIIIDYWVYCIILIIIAGGGLAAWLMLKKKVSVPFMPKPKEVSPYDAAIMGLDSLKEEQLWEKGMEKEFYTRLTDILRQYLEGRFGINAMEMTSSQILSKLRDNSEISRHHALMQRILEIADYVKFAKVRPLPDDNVASWNNAKEFVTDTKPQPESVETESENLGEPHKADNEKNSEK